MKNDTRKVSTSTLQKLVKKYQVTRSGSKTAVALRLWKLHKHTMTLKHLKLIEDFLGVQPAKRYKGPRYYVQKNGTLKCATGNCPER